MIDKEELKEKIKVFNNYVLSFILFYFGVSVSALFRKIAPDKKTDGWKKWSIDYGKKEMEEMY